jgi:acyl carrier protein
MGVGMGEQEQEQGRVLTRTEVEAGLRDILMDSLGVAEAEVAPTASLVRDLGAESIDFLDMGFKIQQAFGVSLQAAEIRDKILAWGTLILPALAEVLTARLGCPVTVEDLKGREGGGIDGVLAHLQAASGVTIGAGTADKVGEELLRRLVKEFSALGFVVGQTDCQNLLTIMRSDLTARRLTERTMDLLTVENMVNYICGKLGPRLADR